MPTVIVPANPGIYALFPDENGKLSGAIPVVAWEIDFNAEPAFGNQATFSTLPIIPGGLPNEVEYVLYPNGRVELLHVSRWDSLDEANSQECCEQRVAQSV